MLKKLNPQVQLKNLKKLIITQLLEENSLLKKNLYQLDTKLKELQDGSNTKQKILKISGEIKDFEVLTHFDIFVSRKVFTHTPIQVNADHIF